MGDGKPRQAHAARAMEIAGPSPGSVLDSLQCRIELVRKQSRYVLVALRVPRDGLLGLRERGRG
jgi:hypothetical protein